MKHAIPLLFLLLIGPRAALFAAAPPQHQSGPAFGFVDALACISTNLVAKPGQDAVLHWSSTSKVSLRIVGHITKSTSNANASFDILIQGKPVSSMELSPQNPMRRSFDVPLCDLEPASEIFFRIKAISGPVEAHISFSILPEPFLSRWSPELSSGYPTWSEPEKKSLRTKGQDILQMIRNASANKQSRIVIPPGDYLFHANWSRASSLTGIHDLEIEAQGVTFWFEPPMVHALLFERCSNVTVRGLTIDFTTPCWFQACVTQIDRTNKTLQTTFMPGYEPRTANGVIETNGQRALMFYDAKGRFINQKHSPGKWQLTGDGKSVICRDVALAGIPATLKPGDYVVGTIRTGAALRSSECSSMRFEDVQVWSSPGMAVYEGGGKGGHLYQRVRATRRPNTNRLHAFGADIFHLAGADRGPILDRCELAYGSDDNLNIHGSFGRVVQRQDAHHYFLQGAYAAGDRIEFRDPGSVSLLGIAKVVSAKASPDGPTARISDKYTAKGEMLVELDSPLELPPLALVVLDGKRSATGFVLRNCWLHDNFQRTLINGSPNGLIENNTLQNVGQGLMIQFETWGPWMEGPFARNLIVRGNRFLDAPPEGGSIIVSMHPPGGGSNARRFEATPVTNLTIISNDFTRTLQPPILIHNVDGLRIEDNSIDYPASAPFAKGRTNSSKANWLYLQDCKNVKLERNLEPPRTSP